VDQKKTQFDILDIVLRCFGECIEAGYIVVKQDEIESHASGLVRAFTARSVIINEQEVASHISKTIIGELLEFEIVRRAAAIEREEERVKRDLEFVASQYKRMENIAGLRIDPGEMPETP
jgi:hypothetical protein